MSENAPVISAVDLVKEFGPVRALDDLNLSIAPGEVHGFLGPNGAGKSTTMRVLLGLLRPDSGTIRLFGRDPWRDAVELHRRLAYVPGDVELWPNLTGGEAIDVFLRLRSRGTGRAFDPTRRDELIERFDLDPRKKTRTYSKGNRQKVALIAALAAEVDLLLLDEPTAGLDPLMEAVFQEVIHEAKAAGRSVLLSSHILSQVEALSDRISIIRSGNIVESGTLSELRHMTRTTIEVQTESPADELASVSFVHAFHTEGSPSTGERSVFEVDGDHVGEVMQRLAGLGVHSIVAHPPTLEQLLMRHYGDDLSARGVSTSTQKKVS
ncbi:ABC transporter ATP-binding protein [Nesterenkonia cremea]|uniref:Tetronasin ABC transporter ATP-binding protein n=1 Tax=Nesterenkonia cremea TaxID=1882340 RepID=A0A917ET79_9MICC|nr:ABC transporter ATP-binding protein [Nesterenkonia cremea]GGE77733.1 tetronasin ABC transporter ATP-binding protein [Nesterenkonia cremea]